MEILLVVRHRNLEAVVGHPKMHLAEIATSNNNLVALHPSVAVEAAHLEGIMGNLEAHHHLEEAALDLEGTLINLEVHHLLVVAVVQLEETICNLELHLQVKAEEVRRKV